MKIVDEYEFLVDRYGVKQIGLVDPIFPLVKKDLKVFCEELVKRGLDEKCKWLSETRADPVGPGNMRTHVLGWLSTRVDGH